MTTTSDLVPVAVLLGIARRVRDRAFAIAKTKNVPIRSAGEILIDPPKTTQSQIAINIRFSNNRIAAFEWGSGIHRERGTPKKYTISANKAPFLIFEGTNQFAGQRIVIPSVDHPGVKARPFLEPAKRQTRQQNLADLRATVNTNLKLIIKGMARKI